VPDSHTTTLFRPIGAQSIPRAGLTCFLAYGHGLTAIWVFTHWVPKVGTAECVRRPESLPEACQWTSNGGKGGGSPRRAVRRGQGFSAMIPWQHREGAAPATHAQQSAKNTARPKRKRTPPVRDPKGRLSLTGHRGMKRGRRCHLVQLSVVPQAGPDHRSTAEDRVQRVPGSKATAPQDGVSRCGQSPPGTGPSPDTRVAVPCTGTM